MNRRDRRNVVIFLALVLAAIVWMWVCPESLIPPPQPEVYRR